MSLAPTPAFLICLKCGHINAPEDWRCQDCDSQLRIPMGEDMGGYIKAADLLRSGQLTAEQLAELLDRLKQDYAYYMAGTLYSVFGPVRGARGEDAND